MPDWTPEQIERAKPRILVACRNAVQAFEAGDLETFWIVAGMIAGACSNSGKYLAESDLIMAAVFGESSLPAAALAASLAIRKIILGYEAEEES